MDNRTIKPVSMAVLGSLRIGNVLRIYPPETQIESRIADLILQAES
jgi:hypothetical protein